MRRRSTQGAFTLIEVLVVVAIIALLVAILLPSLKRARDSARATMCRAHMKEVTNGMLLYLVENKVLPATHTTWYENAFRRSYPTWPLTANPNPKEANLTWEGALSGVSASSRNQPAFTDNVPQRGTIFKYTRDINVYLCPADNVVGEPSSLVDDPDGGPGNGRLSYSMNAYLGYLPPERIRRPAGNYPNSRLRNVPAMGWSESDMPLLMEENPQKNLNLVSLEGNFNTVDRFTFRHSSAPLGVEPGLGPKGRAHLAYLDGHVSPRVLAYKVTGSHLLAVYLGMPVNDNNYINWLVPVVTKKPW